jgi:hypothetical protein
MKSNNYIVYIVNYIFVQIQFPYKIKKIVNFWPFQKKIFLIPFLWSLAINLYNYTTIIYMLKFKPFFMWPLTMFSPLYIISPPFQKYLPFLLLTPWTFTQTSTCNIQNHCCIIVFGIHNDYHIFFTMLTSQEQFNMSKGWIT